VYLLVLWIANLLWYQYDSFTQFHWFDDLAEWKQMDKLGHIFSAFYLSKYTYQFIHYFSKNQPTLLVKKTKLLLISAIIGFVLLSSIEILDGFAPAYGASLYDLLANLVGAILFFLQMNIFEKIILSPKFSFHFTNFASQRPNILGDNYLTQIIKDYNGQTYWYVIPLSFFLKKLKLNILGIKWLGIALGYSANNMVFGRDFQNQQIGYIPFRRYFISLDINLQSVQTKFRWINFFCRLMTMVRLPLPALEWNERDGFVWHWLYF
jgi:VanZ family protein